MVSLKNMHIREPASKLSKDVGTPLKFYLGNREATLFTKSTEYGKHLDNGVNEYLAKDRENRDMRERFVQHFNIAEDPPERETFVSATPSVYEEQANEEEARAEANRVAGERQRRREEAREAVRPVIEEMLNETMNDIDRKIRKKRLQTKSVRVWRGRSENVFHKDKVRYERVNAKQRPATETTPISKAKSHRSKRAKKTRSKRKEKRKCIEKFRKT